MAKDDQKDSQDQEAQKQAKSAARAASTNNIPVAERCPDCDGQGIRNPEIDHQVCQTCGGSGRAAGATPAEAPAIAAPSEESDEDSEGGK